ncbi:MAG: DUF115 domain-containing protein [Spirochaetaceae bacterium]|jgi:hypothetical protein|nr:DUF115 domain-containing protein [Spirochaetaceae bacterium]
MSDQSLRQTAAGRGFSVSYKGKTLLSTVDPIAQAERIVLSVSKRERTLYLCPSPLYGYGLDALAESLSPDSAVLCVEADPELLNLSVQAMRGLLEVYAGTVQLVGSAEPGTVCGAVRKIWGPRRFRRVETIRLSGGWQLFPAEYDALAETLRQDFAVDWGNAMTLTKLGRRYILNAVRNLALIPRAYSLRDLDFGDAPVLALGAGPSLDAILERLPQKNRPFKIICVDTALPVLKERNIKPDLAVILESQHWNLRDFIGLGDWEIPTAMDLSALPASGSVLRGKVLLFATPWTELRLFRRLASAGLLPELMHPLGSVGLTMVAAALRVSRGLIITSGLDFSYTLDSFHARSAPSHREELYRQTRFRSILNGDTAFRAGSFGAIAKSGIPVRTNPALKTYRDLFERTFAGISRIQDIAGPGLALGVQTLSLEEALRALQSGIFSHSATSDSEDSSFSFFSQKENFSTSSEEDTKNAQKENLSKKSFTSSEEEAKNAQKENLSKKKSAEAFIREERDRLIALRAILTGEISGNSETLETLLDEADYLWAHFPDCAGAGGRRPPGTDPSFIKRVRAEIDPLIRSFNLALADLF